MPDLADACSYSLVQSVLFGSEVVECQASFDESFLPYLEPGFQCTDPYGDWSDWTTYDAQTDVRMRHKKEFLLARRFDCDTTEYDFRATPTNAPSTPQTPTTPPPSVTYPPGTQFGSDSFKLCFWCRRIV